MLVKKIVTPALLLLLMSVVFGLPLAWSNAQELAEIAPAQFGDPPRAHLISISEANDNGVVIIRGETGAVFPGAVVVIRNMYTGQTVYPRAEITGAFIGEIYGPGNTPFWISPAHSVDNLEQNVPGSLPGGPGTIIYGPLPESYDPPPLPEPEVAVGPQTQIVIDGDALDWRGLETAATSALLAEGQEVQVAAFVNLESLYLAIQPVMMGQILPAEYSWLEVDLLIEDSHFRVRLDPRRGNGGRFYEVAPDGLTQDRGPLAGFSAQAVQPGGAIELRLPLVSFTGFGGPVTVQAVRFVRSDEDLFLADLLLNVAERDEIDRLNAVPPLELSTAAIPFTLAGPVGGGSGLWEAVAQINQVNFAPGEEFLLEMQVTIQAPEMIGTGADLQLGAVLQLEPVTVNGSQTVADRATGNGWSGILTPAGMAVENVPGGLLLGDATAQQVVVADGVITFKLQWTVPIGAELPSGLYTPSLMGYVTVPGLYNTWQASGLLGSGPGLGIPQTRLPLVLNIGADSVENRLALALFEDDPAGSGARGILPVEDRGVVALANRVAYGNDVYVLPRLNPVNGEPFTYPLEPYLPAWLGNSYTQMVAPLVPLAFAEAELTVTVTDPDGVRQALGTVPLRQNTLSSATRIESFALGTTSPLDIYRLTTLEPELLNTSFAQDGRHEIEISAVVHDIWGNAYQGGGTYEVWLAESFQMLPGVLPGTPFEVGDIYHPALTLVPAFPADITTRLTVFPLDGGEPLVQELTGTANEHGYFLPEGGGEPWVMDTPGEYVVDTVATYTDSLDRLWVGSVRGAGVIASPDSVLTARGGRDLSQVNFDDHLAWYNLNQLAPGLLRAAPEAALRWPYHSGDVLWVRDRLSRVWAGQRLTDVVGDLSDWLTAALPGWSADDGLSIHALANLDELPVMVAGTPHQVVDPGLAVPAIPHEAYAYLSAVRPGLAVRQLVMGGEEPGLYISGWAFDDPYNHQRGMGLNGDLPGDYAFLFGGAIVRNEDLDLREAAIYGAVLLVTDQEDGRGDRVFPPFQGAADGPDGGPLLTVRGAELEMFFASTGFQPGQVFTVGDTLALGGQVAPAVGAWVQADVITPSGLVLPIGGATNAVGYYYDPGQHVTLFEPGIWRIRLRTGSAALTSAGRAREPFPTGGVIGAEDTEFTIYVLPEDELIIELENPRTGDGFMPVALPFNVTVAVPPEWADVQLNYTVLMNGMILDRGVQPALGDIYAYNYDPRHLHDVFPNLDITVQNTQIPYSIDAVRLSFVLSGTGEDGEPVLAGRTLTLFGDRLITLHDGWPTPE
ncbi:hypothetical protein ACFLYO_06295 [Chloroflexota bacterium]